MIEFLALPEKVRKQMIEQASIRSGMNVNSVEKDWWVTLVLKALFTMPEAQHFTFKGGTSLSKAWKIIERFSEDVDIALAPEAFGKEYQEKPSNTYVKNLKKEGCAFTSTVILNSLTKRLEEMGLDLTLVKLEAEEVKATLPDKDPQVLFVHYPSLFDPNPYLPDRVKLEFGVRSLKVPFADAQIHSVIADAYPNNTYKEDSFTVIAVAPHKTLLEKLLLLHEKFVGDPDAIDIAERQSRHLSDLVKMSAAGTAKVAMADVDLHMTLLEHRKHYVRIKGVDYTDLHFRNLAFVPPPQLLEKFKRDYIIMLEQMIYDQQAPDFDTLMVEMNKLQELFRKI